MTAAPSTPDRLQALRLDQELVTGIDFVQVAPDHRTLRVHFLKAPSELSSPLGPIPAAQVTIASRTEAGIGAGVPLQSAPVWAADDPDVLQIVTTAPGGGGPHVFEIDHPRIDPYYCRVHFTFTADCPSDVDCRPRGHECPPEEWVDFPVDYLARDFQSFRRALMEFAAQRYPDWIGRDREADVGVMLAEVMSAVGDEFSYYQDRVAREAHLETATQRRSLRRHARLVDYHVHDGLGSRTWLAVEVHDGLRGEVRAGLSVTALSDGGQAVPFQLGRSLREMLAGERYGVDARLNAGQLSPHQWDEDDACLPVGATELFVDGHLEGELDFRHDSADGRPGKWFVLRTRPEPGTMPRVWMVRVVEATNQTDPIPGFHGEVTRLVWEDDQALPFEMDLSVLEVSGNVVPASGGETVSSRFVIGSVPESAAVPVSARAQLARAVERVGPNGTVAYLHTLPSTPADGLVWIGESPTTSQPEVVLKEESYDPAADAWVSAGDPALSCNEDPEQWCWRRSLVGETSSQPRDRDFTLEDGEWSRVVGYQRGGEEVVHVDYKAGAGTTLRFGDGEFGLIPVAGTVLLADYRVGNGRRANVGADTIREFDRTAEVYDATGNPTQADLLIRSITNPLPAEGGVDPESALDVRRFAPDAFRAVTYRAVTERDYAAAGERLPWVQRAGARFRWTGSWLTSFVTPDPLGAVTVSPERKRDLGLQLERFRQVGREAYVHDPVYADLDLEITICVDPSSYPGHVKPRVLEALVGMGSRDGAVFFSPDRFTFGTPLHRSRLEAAIQAVTGVRAVGPIELSRRGWFEKRLFSEDAYRVGDGEVIRVENDPRHPDRGSVRLVMEGGL